MSTEAWAKWYPTNMGSIYIIVVLICWLQGAGLWLAVGRRSMFGRLPGAGRSVLLLKMGRLASFHLYHPPSIHATYCCSSHATSTVCHLTWRGTRSNSSMAPGRVTLLEQNAHLLPHPCSSQTRTFASVAAFLSPDFLPIKCAQQVLETVHDTTGLPWWASIMLSTFIMRTLVTFPLAVYAQYNAARVNNLKVQVAETAKELKAEVDVAAQRYQWNEKVAKYQFHLNVSCTFDHAGRKRISICLLYRDWSFSKWKGCWRWNVKCTMWVTFYLIIFVTKHF